MVQATLSVKLQPRASKEEVVGLVDGVFRIKVTAPPVQGKANQALVRFLAKTLGISATQVSIVKGATSHHKIVAIEGLTQEEVTAKLLAK